MKRLVMKVCNPLFRIRFQLLARLSLALFPLISGVSALAQDPATPAPVPGFPQNIFFGETPVGGEDSPVLVFVHGLRSQASDWWQGSDMYVLAFAAGYRTAFININSDNSRNDAGIEENAAALQRWFPEVARRFGVSKFYIICHSKGGADTQAALMSRDVSRLAKAVFTISTPHHGTELADWLFGTLPGSNPILEGVGVFLRWLGGGLGLLSPGVAALTTENMSQFRAQADPYFISAGIAFFTLEGSTFEGNPFTSFTGQILSDLTDGQVNDGFVTVENATLKTSYARDLGQISANHFQSLQGSSSFGGINLKIQELEGSSGAEFALNTPEWMDDQNTFVWSMKWFKGKLYVGTGRAIECVSFASAEVEHGKGVYPPLASGCPQDFADLELAAEIWRYTPETRLWERVFKSPQNIPVKFDSRGNATGFTARDIAFRSMEVFIEPSGAEALYVGGTSAGSLFGKLSRYAGRGFPPPRLLRSPDGVRWQAVPQAAGTFLGDISKNSPPNSKVRSFASLASYNGQLFVISADYQGVGSILSSANPSAGNNAWRRVSPPATAFPVSALHPYNGFLYCTTGDSSQKGYGVSKTEARGSPPYRFVPVVSDGAFQPAGLRSSRGLSMGEFEGKLYVGTNQPAELIRIDPDDVWELVVGEPRSTPTGWKTPLSGLGAGFGNFFNARFWSMASDPSQLYLGTFDWSINLRPLSLVSTTASLAPQYGFDFLRSQDGRHWTVVSRSGLGDPLNYGLPVLESTPVGLFAGTSRPEGESQVWWNERSSSLDLDGDGDVDQNDVNRVLAARNRPASGQADPRDLDHDGLITVADARKLLLLCDRSRCAVSDPPAPAVAPPERLEAASEQAVGSQVILSWEASPGVSQYRVFRSQGTPAPEFLPPYLEVTIPGTDFTVTVTEILDGALGQACLNESPTLIDCSALQVFQNSVGFPGPFELVGSTSQLFFREKAPTKFQSLYYVQALDSQGRLSAPSNIVGGPSKAAPTTFASVETQVRSLSRRGFIQDSFSSDLLSQLEQARTAAERRDFPTSRSILNELEQSLDEPRPAGISDLAAEELLVLLQSLSRNVWLAQSGQLP
ncbi:MAG: esterase/lipase family protein [Acidobacteriota bacterium]